ncbi:MAG: aldehyde dehydrogenase family protein [Myxococcales bacterium]|nr:aldehyde dehydrogenase family protein [Myxococcales bacterium]
MKFDVKNPITGASIYQIEDASEAQVREAFANARRAQPTIAAMSVAQRIEAVMAINRYVLDNRESILDRIIAETGKSRFDAFTAEVFEVCDVIDHFKNVAPKVLADQKVHTPIFLMGKKSMVWHEPLGTVLVIAPWNFPFYQGMVPAILAFLAGNAVIFKPSELTPLQGLWEDLIEKTKFPKHALQVVYGGRATGAALIAEKPGKVHFTGSVRAGREIGVACAKELIPVDLELGGKDPGIVFDDVDVTRTANGIMWGAFTNAGQSCTSLERLYVQDTIYDRLVPELVRLTKQLRTSHADRHTRDPGDCDIGAITSPAQISIIEEHIDDAVARGAKVLCGGVAQRGSAHMLPTIVADCDHSMKIASEETFGPVLAVMKFTSENQAIALANDSPYGLGASVWSRDLDRAVRVARQIVTGNVSINNHMITEANPALPFGGTKHSGIGRYKGDWGLTTFCNVKSVVIDKQSETIEPHWYPFTKAKYALLTNVMLSYFAKHRDWVRFAASGLKLDSIGKKEKLP